MFKTNSAPIGFVLLVLLTAGIRGNAFAGWNIQTVDSDGMVGDDVSLVLDSADRPRIGYYDYTNSSLKLAAACVSTLNSDLNGDCYVNFPDLAEFCNQWLECSAPFDPACQ